MQTKPGPYCHDRHCLIYSSLLVTSVDFPVWGRQFPYGLPSCTVLVYPNLCLRATFKKSRSVKDLFVFSRGSYFNMESCLCHKLQVIDCDWRYDPFWYIPSNWSNLLRPVFGRPQIHPWLTLCQSLLCLISLSAWGFSWLLMDVILLVCITVGYFADWLGGKHLSTHGALGVLYVDISGTQFTWGFRHGSSRENLEAVTCKVRAGGAN